MKAAPKQANNDSNRSTAEATQGGWEKQSAQATAGNGRTAAAQRALVSGINDSPRMLAQRRRIEGYSGIAQPPISEAAPPASPIAQQPIQRLEKPDNEEEETLQPKFASEPPAQLERQATPKPNNTGLPDNLKSGIEALSGLSMDNVKVHYNSSQPAQLNALAYAQATDIHVAPGQEKHLPHEAWHVVQQAQGRVKPTMQAKGMAINDDHGLEREADVMGERTVQMMGMQKARLGPYSTRTPSLTAVANNSNILQMCKKKGKKGKREDKDFIGDKEYHHIHIIGGAEHYKYARNENSRVKITDAKTGKFVSDKLFQAIQSCRVQSTRGKKHGMEECLSYLNRQLEEIGHDVKESGIFVDGKFLPTITDDEINDI